MVKCACERLHLPTLWPSPVSLCLHCVRPRTQKHTNWPLTAGRFIVAMCCTPASMTPNAAAHFHIKHAPPPPTPVFIIHMAVESSA